MRLSSPLSSAWRAVALTAVAALSLTACSSGAGGSGADAARPADGSDAGQSSAAPGEEPTPLTVFAAASLKDAFPEIAETVLAHAHPGVEVTFSFAGSSDLVDQMAGGAPVDVFASADRKNMDNAVSQSLVDDATNVSFASNTLTLVTPPDNPAGVTGVDSSLDGADLVICAEGVPCGNATIKLEESLGVTLNPVSEEQSVTDVLGKVENGEADAGIVYVTDAQSAGDKVTTIAINGADSIVNDYRIAVAAGSANTQAARWFLDAVMSDAGQKILAGHGFAAPVS